jgi:hypothetical protein
MQSRLASPSPALQLAWIQDLGYNAAACLAADCPPEFDSFKERLLELAQIRSVADMTPIRVGLPVLSRKRLDLRSEDRLVCLDLSRS